MLLGMGVDQGQGNGVGSPKIGVSCLFRYALVNFCSHEPQSSAEYI